MSEIAKHWIDGERTEQGEVFVASASGNHLAAYVFVAGVVKRAIVFRVKRQPAPTRATPDVGWR